MSAPSFTVAFTGHRPSGVPGRTADDLRQCRPALEDVWRTLAHNAESRGASVEVVTGVAAGADVEAAEAALEVGLTLRLLLPLPVAMLRDDYPGELAEDGRRAESLIALAEDPQTPHTVRVVEGDHRRPEAYEIANRAMLDASQALVAVSLTGDATNREGAQAVIEDARRRNMPIITIDPSRQGAVTWAGPWGDANPSQSKKPTN